VPARPLARCALPALTPAAAACLAARILLTWSRDVRTSELLGLLCCRLPERGPAACAQEHAGRRGAQAVRQGGRGDAARAGAHEPRQGRPHPVPSGEQAGALAGAPRQLGWPPEAGRRAHSGASYALHNRAGYRLRGVCAKGATRGESLLDVVVSCSPLGRVAWRRLHAGRRTARERGPPAACRGLSCADTAAHSC